MTHEMKLPNGDVIREGEYSRTRDGRKVLVSRYEDQWQGECGGQVWGYTATGRWGHCSGQLHDDLRRRHEIARDIIAAWRDETATPTLWRDMTPEEKGALLLAHHEGKVIEWNGTSVKTGQWTGWEACDGDCLWDETFTGDGFAYRIRPEPKRETVTLYGGGHLYHWSIESDDDDTHRITFDMIDNQPDCASIRMEAIE